MPGKARAGYGIRSKGGVTARLMGYRFRGLGAPRSGEAWPANMARLVHAGGAAWLRREGRRTMGREDVLRARAYYKAGAYYENRWRTTKNGGRTTEENRCVLHGARQARLGRTMK